jgi:formate dehydrogenase maturation protein FdhE
MSKNCHHCSSRKGRRYYVLDINNETLKIICCNKCKPTFPSLYYAKPARKELLLDQVITAMLGTQLL